MLNGYGVFCYLQVNPMEENMGGLGLEIAENYTRLTTVAEEPKKTKKRKQYAFKQEHEDTPFQKFLAYCSYYQLVFVAIGMMMPTKVTAAAKTVESLF